MPVTSTTKNTIMLTALHLLGPLWRLCTSLASYRSGPGGTQSLQNSGSEFESLSACRLGGSPSGKAMDCNPITRRFDSGSAQLVVTPTRFPRIGEHCLMGA